MSEMLCFIDIKMFNEEIKKIQNKIISELLKENNEKIDLRYEELKLCMEKQFWIREVDKRSKD